MPVATVAGMASSVSPQPGDVFLLASPTFVGKAIRLITRSRWNHAGLIVSVGAASDPEWSMITTVEALHHGTRRGELRTGPILILRPPYNEREHGFQDERDRAIAEADLNAKLGIPYAFADILWLALAQFGLRTRWLRHNLGRPDRMFCSQEVDFELSHAGVEMFDDGRMPQDVTPGDLEELAIAQGWQMGLWRYVNSADRS